MTNSGAQCYIFDHYFCAKITDPTPAAIYVRDTDASRFIKIVATFLAFAILDDHDAASRAFKERRILPTSERLR